MPGRRLFSSHLFVMDDWQGMEARRNQRMLSATTAIEGIGYWSGRDVRVEFRPAEPQQGIVSCGPICRAVRGFRP